MQYETLIETLTAAVGAYYTGDASTAGLVVARLPGGPWKTSADVTFRCGGTWYVSIVRYREPLGRGKIVVCSAQARQLRDALVAVATQWHKSCEGAVDGRAAVGKMLERFPK